MAKDKAREALAINNKTYVNYLNRLKHLALTMFQWEGLPDTMNPRFLEKCLYEQGIAVMVYDEVYGFINTRCVPSGQLNIYEEPVHYTAQGLNYYRRFGTDECCIVRNNPLVLPTLPVIEQYAYRLYQVERTIDVNINGQKTPILLVCDDKQRLTLSKMYGEYDGNEPVIYGDKTFNPDCIKSIKTDVPFLADKLLAYKHDLWNECMTFLGIKNANIDKRERLITDEVNSNNQQTELSAEVMLATRQEAADRFNKMYGLNISVRLRSEQEVKEQGDGEVHNDSE